MDNFQIKIPTCNSEMLQVGNISDYNNLNHHMSLSDSAEATRRRSSNRSIKRKKFDDELVEYSLGMPGVSNIKSNRTRTQSYQSDFAPVGSPSTPVPPVAPPAQHVTDTKRKSLSKSAPSSSKSKKRSTPKNHVTTKDLGRWKPIDDLALIIEVEKREAVGQLLCIISAKIRLGYDNGWAKRSRFCLAHKNRCKLMTNLKQFSNLALRSNLNISKSDGEAATFKFRVNVDPLETKWALQVFRQQHQKHSEILNFKYGVQQTNDLKTVHLGTKFSCKFTLHEVQSRWYALLYDQAVSRVAVSAMRNLHPDMIAAVQDKALWSNEEEKILTSIKSNTNPTLETFGELLVKHSDIFYNGRTPNSLFRHWQSLRMYHLLPDQTVGALPTAGRPVMSFNDAEELIQDSELTDPPDEALDKELKIQQRRNIKEIRQLENEVGRWNVLVNTVTGICPGELDGQTLAVLRGRMVRYLMRSREITIGRSGKGHNVDIDLSLEGPAYKISRRQATLRLRNTGEFYLSSEGKRPIFVDGKPISAGTKVRLYDNAVVEIACLRFVFSINHDLIRAIHNESVKYNLPP